MAAPDRPRSVSSVVVTAVAVAAAALVGWLLLLMLKGIVVLGTYAVGIALIVVPLLLARRVVSGTRGRDRRRRILGIAAAVAAGVVLCAVANLVDDHGWLLVAIPAAVILVERLVDQVQDRRRR